MANFARGGSSIEPKSDQIMSTYAQSDTFDFSEKVCRSHHNNLILCFTCLLKDGKEVRIKVTKIVVKVEGSEVWEEITDFEINSGGGKVTRIDLDPNESRDYSIRISSPGDRTFDYEVTASDNAGFQFVLRGHRTGVALADMPKSSEKALDDSHITLGRVVRINPTLWLPCRLDKRFYPEGSFVISPGTFASTALGIFANGDTSIKSYIALGDDGYKQLVNQYTTQLEWDRDTAAYPPSDLTAVHVTDVSETTKQGWVMKTNLLFDTASESL